MRNHFKWVLGFALLVLANSTSFADKPAVDDKAKMQDIKQMLKATGEAEALVNTFMDALEPAKKGATGDQLKFIMECQKEMKNSQGELEDKLAALYAEHFTDDDIKEMSKFYQTPVGLKCVKELRTMGFEMFSIGKDWGASIREKVLKKMGKSSN